MSDALKICHVNLARGFRGGERQTELLIRALSGQGIRQKLIARKDQPLARRCADVNGLEIAEIGKPFGWHWQAGKDWLLHAHEAKAVRFAHRCYRKCGSPYILTRRVDNVPGDRQSTRSAHQDAAAVVAISAAIRKVLLDYEPKLEKQPGIDIVPSVCGMMQADQAAVAQLKQRWSGDFVVGHVGALDNSQKGQYYLIEAARALSVSHPQVRFVLLGAGKDETAFKTQAKGLGNIVFEGHVTNVADYLAAFDLFAFPSLHEGLGSTLLDAMSFGLAIVASDVDGIPEIIKHEDNGLLVPPADAAQLQQALVRLIEDDDLCAKLGRNGLQRVSEYTPEIMARSYLDIYRSIAKGMRDLNE